MPIGNLTSQIFANIYLNELDRFVKHELKVQHYLRYGDDFIMLGADERGLKEKRVKTIVYLKNVLKLDINLKNDKILKPGHGLKFLGVVIWPGRRKLNNKNRSRLIRKLNNSNFSSYYGLISKNEKHKQMKRFNWLIYELLKSKN
jgi:hypothetical protein